MSGPLTVKDLCVVDLLHGLEREQLAEWLAVAEGQDVAAGGIIVEQGVPAPGVHLLLEGTVEMFMVSDGRAEPMGYQHAPTWMGAIGVLTENPIFVRTQARTDCRLALLPADDFRRLALAHPAVHGRVMRQIAPVMQRVQAIESSRDRLESLGTMAAGLAHELNNPAAAAKRASAQMAEALDVLSSTLGMFVDAGIERADAQVLSELQREALARAAGLTALSALDAADAEDAIAERLEDLGVEQAWEIAEPLAAAGLDEAWLEQVVTHAGPALDAALRWVAAALTARGLAAELRESTRRMSELVGAVKAYAYMDRGAVVEVDLHEGLETTLTVLGHKLKQTTIRVVRDYDRALPHLTVRGSELNQVWTNLLDNAIDALGESGTITLTTRRDGERALVEIADDGPGIPDEVVAHIFDSFYTTKDVGRGTGLGLATARRIVVDRHGGSIIVGSEPGRTAFRVWLPLTAPD
ncbi:ATP-binding protein [Paraconexibacter antarcticus]|uniref:histidine kinase n=1 Tax=Paraconexibacter antarcticus TaxID=2949664 RepID=A0ABY5DLT5_9ACTN|nr:ATP-binding protein [Paraconexibacter antarcticus]UTI62841.1 ATP-binding protein [Paraconexibacter antarcticus]